MPKQSTNHILLIKPASFYSNEQTADTNLYQHSHEEKDKNEAEELVRILQDPIKEADKDEKGRSQRGGNLRRRLY